jgi:hypothetical protein
MYHSYPELTTTIGATSEDKLLCFYEGRIVLITPLTMKQQSVSHIDNQNQNCNPFFVNTTVINQEMQNSDEGVDRKSCNQRKPK